MRRANGESDAPSQNFLRQSEVVYNLFESTLSHEDLKEASDCKWFCRLNHLSVKEQNPPD